MPDPRWPPTYNRRYGFDDGAQLDIFNDVSKTICPEKAKVPAGEASTAVPLDTTEAERTGEATPGAVAQPGQQDQAVFQAKAVPQAESGQGQKDGEARPDADASNTSEYEILFNPFRTGDQAQQAFLAVPVPSATAKAGAEVDDAARRGF